MASIYNIQQDLLDIFAQVEENEGELTPELEEQLNITQDEFKDKIQAYTNVIKQFELEIKGIKEEQDRLNNLKKSKEKTIDRLKDIIKTAIMYFGDTTKTGSKFIDYGLGKVSLRRSENIELDDDSLKKFINRFISYFQWLNYRNEFDYTELNTKEIVDYCNQKEDTGCDIEYDTDFQETDIEALQAILDLKINLKDLITTEKGQKLIKAMLEYSPIIDAKPVVDKKAIKDNIKNNTICPTFAKLVSKQNVIIK